ncbi:MAG: radical SAM family heme chaperone HemW [Bacteroidota bacterium]|nr:radical SAM family heme chaperone HemW [Bacteroidota bacterium]MEC8031964.1 radical SAM family heme chaperone HemW [Bacteroidota bacterium]MEC8626919.1 radical SAM family heme chaperone HemW [Bacteroidota bacterium]MEC8756555.1 radical SAM family heme chaperone HemW [Bacteroidota bacterium]MEC8836165.1 radical SAM family heme chaperone HemW [Bacteroidota bacterium]
MIGAKQEQGVYIHVPFCQQACSYCNFYFVTGQRDHADFITAATREIKESRGFFGKERMIHSIYFGGGTPSRLALKELESILNQVRATFIVSTDAEITLEANPEDITKDLVNAWFNLGINRISLGIQSFNDKLLALMRRAHDGKEALHAASIIKQSSFTNFSFDLIIGQIQQDLNMLDQDLRHLESFKPPHLSTYLLTVEEKTHLHKEIQRKRLPDVADRTQEEHYLRLMKWAQEWKYAHYETSSFAFDGHRARHNANYWNHSPYLGIGPSAHSFDGKKRYWNSRNLNEYIASATASRKEEYLSRIDFINEKIMLGLRQSKGIIINHLGLSEIERRALDKSLQAVNPLHIEYDSRNIRLSNEGKLYADGIAATLFF